MKTALPPRAEFCTSGSIAQRVSSAARSATNAVFCCIPKPIDFMAKWTLLEIHQGPSLEYFPVEYKRGKSKPEDWDRLQLCAQALCLEEMRNTTINKGAIWYWQVRRREPVLLDQALREKTRAAIAAAHQILASARTPRAVYHNKKCRACSLKALCRPQLFSRDRSARYIESMEI